MSAIQGQKTVDKDPKSNNSALITDPGTQLRSTDHRDLPLENRTCQGEKFMHSLLNPHFSFLSDS